MSSFSEYIGRSRTMNDIVDPWRMQALCGALDINLPVSPGDPMPLPFQFMLFPEATTRAKTGTDGHPLRGEFMPPVELPRRMFAGARMKQSDPLIIGQSVEKIERIKSVDFKSGSSGGLCIVVVEYEYRQAGKLCLHEERDIIYRERGSSPVRQPGFAPVEDMAWSEDWQIDPVLLFRFSALTYNSHRIHYDRDFAIREEKYPDLVVHGPLLATLLCRLAEKNTGRHIREIKFRAQRPIFHGAPVRLRGGADDDINCTLQAYTNGGDIAMQAHVSF